MKFEFKMAVNACDKKKSALKGVLIFKTSFVAYLWLDVVARAWAIVCQESLTCLLAIYQLPVEKAASINGKTQNRFLRAVVSSL